MKRKIRMGMVGGGQGAFIGAVHRMAATLDGHIELVCGAFSSTPEKSKASGKELYLPEDRAYGDFQEMIEREKALPEDVRMDFISIVTPNYMHFPPAKLALENGFHVVSDKPATFTLEEAKELQTLVDSTGLLYALTHNYTGYPMVKEAKHLVSSGKLGKIRKVVVEYPQGWLAQKLEAEGQKQASWRTDPKRAGISNCRGDVGTHAENLAEYITGLQITELCADLTAFGDGRELDTDGNVLLRFNNGARGVLHASQISVGEENAFKIYAYGEKGGIEWHQMNPNTLLVKWPDRPVEIYRTGGDHDYLSDHAMHNTRLPAGHPEGYIEAFANVYRNVALTLQARLSDEEVPPYADDFPTIEDAVRGMAFVKNVVESSKSDQKWYPFTI
ncbi:MAG: Gfo/Idh/MocA family oxidoreductase [Tunicatimonas sp.]|uniref:Gfo/Idh/MocA family protein n=1 Tax=Tunicatimonas sp. TaxID=1940096 RepID=UPI003C72BACF